MGVISTIQTENIICWISLNFLFSGRTEVVRKLVNKQALTHITDERGNNACDIALVFGKYSQFANLFSNLSNYFYILKQVMKKSPTYWIRVTNAKKHHRGRCKCLSAITDARII